MSIVRSPRGLCSVTYGIVNRGSKLIEKTCLSSACGLYSTRVALLQCFGKFFVAFGGKGVEPDRLRLLRLRAVMSQEQLADRSGVARDTISKLETGQRRAYPSTIRKLALGLDVKPQMLMGGVEYLDEGPVEEVEEKAPEKPDTDRKIGF
jgi:DNA-binding XRE family transcriptional regulator